MKRLVKVVFVLVLFFVFTPPTTEARSGCCSYHGGVCGCSCCDGSPLSSTCAPYYPECGGGGYGGYGSTYKATPSCPLMSTYNSITEKCECFSGYVASGSSCISLDQWCKNKYGYNAQSDYSDSCKCRYGYVWNSSGTACVSEDQACQSQYGYNSKASLSGGQCECKYGYVWNSSQTRCISADQSCQDKYGYNAKSTPSGDKCECRMGYLFNKSGNKCITQNAACQELNGLMSKYNLLTDQCECLDGYKYNGSECELDEQEIAYKTRDIIPTVSNLNSRKPTPILTPKTSITPTPVFSLPTKFPDITTSQSSQSWFQKIINWLFQRK